MGWFELEKAIESENKGFITIHTPVYTCAWEKEVTFQNNSESWTTEDESIKETVIGLVAEKLKIRDRLTKLNEQLDILDPMNVVERFAEKTAERMNGGKAR